MVMGRQARGIAAQEAFVQAAGLVFADTNFLSATLQDVAKAAGMGIGSLYYHFDTKEALALEVIRRQHQVYMRAGNAMLRGDASSSLEGLVRLSHILSWQITNDPVVRAGLRLSTESATVFNEPVSAPYQDWLRLVESFVHRAIAQDYIDTSADANEIAFLIISAFTGTHTVATALHGDRTLESRLCTMWRLILPGIVRPERWQEVQYLTQLTLTPGERESLVDHYSSTSTSSTAPV